MIELEELVLENNKRSNNTHVVSVTRGGCRNFCSMGPNVHTSVKHFTKVNSIEACEGVIASCYSNTSGLCSEHQDGQHEANDRNNNIPFQTKMMLRRASQHRWQCVREIARLRASRVKIKESKIDSVRSLVEKCCNIETNATKSNSQLHQRAQRRQQRFHSLLDQIVHDNEELSDDSESEEDSGDDSPELDI
mmetsp:Transcript_17265/g.24940  ORF Transcript_17265/g.24940 Transcript_17265/m.24940 type:complete len:192 (-) Transcript_17265:42-617(-)